MKRREQEDHNLALRRIAAAKADGERALCLSPHVLAFGGKTYLGDDRFAHLTALPPEIAGLTALQRLDLDSTQITDIAPLAGLIALQELDLRHTQVADIVPLARLEKLHALNFGNIPACAADPKLAELSEIRDEQARTRRTLAYLRGEESIDEPEWGDEDTARPTPDLVRTVQQRLAEAGFNPGPADGL